MGRFTENDTGLGAGLLSLANTTIFLRIKDKITLFLNFKNMHFTLITNSRSQG